jgi:putative oxidoreductase
MQKIKTPARYIFGLLWLIFGLNFFFQFFQVPPPSEKAGALLGALFQTGYFFPFVKITEVLVGIALLTNLFVPLALIIIAPISINIFLIHLLLDPGGALIGVVIVLLNLILGIAYLDHFKAILKMRA